MQEQLSRIVIRILPSVFNNLVEIGIKMEEKGDHTPGSQALIVMQELVKDVVFKTPTFAVKKKAKRKVLDEDAYIEVCNVNLRLCGKIYKLFVIFIENNFLQGIEKIIQRDFFPDLEKLKAQYEYLEAIEKNDVVKIREMHLQYTGKKPITPREPSPASFETPIVHQNTSNRNNNAKDTANAEQIPETQIEPKSDQKINLDAYLSVHTSEDNESFNDIMEENERKHRLKYSYLYNEETKSIEEQNMQLALPSIQKQCELPEKKLNIDTWSYRNKNYIMYIPDGVEPTKEEIVEMNKKKQEVIYTNTRLRANPFNEEQSKETIIELAKTQAKVCNKTSVLLHYL